jgi:MFS family permease
LIGRRYVALLGALFVCVGMIIVGTAQRMDVAIGGMAIAGVGAGLGELVGASGIAELAPVRSRGKYIGLAFLLILPFSASAAYGSFPHLKVRKLTGNSSVVCRFVDVEMGCLDQSHH